MSSRICGKCGSHEVVDEGYYYGSSFFRCNTCGQLGMREKFPEMTVFYQITASPEVLVEKLVYCENEEHIFSCASWRSTLLGNTSYARKDEAIAATLERLNSPINDVKEKVE